MKKYIASVLLLLCAFTISAQEQYSGRNLSINKFTKGIFITSAIPVLIVLDAVQISVPTQSCYITGLEDHTTYIVLAYLPTLDGSDPTAARPIFKQDVYYQGKHVNLNIQVPPQYPPRPPYIEPPLYGNGGYGKAMVMSPADFDVFLASFKKNRMYSERQKFAIEGLIKQRMFITCSYMVHMVDNIPFTNDKLAMIKMSYQIIIDKQNFDEVLSTLSFNSDREEVINWVRQNR